MKRVHTFSFLLLFAALSLWAAGCATPDVNPAQARANTGYVDFRSASAEVLYWQVKRFNDEKHRYDVIYSELESPTGGILRLAFPPGRHRLQIGFLNVAITRPLEVEVEVHDGQSITVHVTLTSAGTAMVETRRESYGGTAKGRVGRRVIIGSEETTIYGLSAVVDAHIAYQPKARAYER